MCGLVGVITGSHKVSYEKFFKQALIVDVLRGVHSTGAASCGQKAYSWAKKAINSHDFVDMKCFADLLRTCPVSKAGALLGHNRAATVGKVNNVNAHPFTAGDIIGMHNGTLKKYNKLTDTSFVTDSECLINHINEEGILDALCNVEGAYALVWYDAEEDKVYMIRNDERPLWLAKVDKEDTILYASEPGMLKWIAERTGHTLNEMWQPEENHLLTFDLDKKDKVAIPTVSKLKVVSEYPAPAPYKAPSYNAYGGRHAHGGGASRFPVPTQDKIFKEWGVREGLTVEGFVCSHTPYTNNSEGLGSAEVVMMNDPWLTLTVHSVRAEEFPENMTGSFHIKRVYCSGSIAVEEPTVIAQLVGGSQTQEKKPEASGTGMYRGPEDTLMYKEAIDKLVQHGCCMCGDPILEEEYQRIEWHGDNPVCPYCLEDFIENIGHGAAV